MLKKENAAKNAKAHTEDVAIRYKQAIKNAIDNSVIIRGKHNVESFYNKENSNKPKIFVANTDTVSALTNKDFKNNTITILNFASYKNPGGGYIRGSVAQEECLCAESFLYNVLSDKKFADYYNYNKAHPNNGLYSNAAIYTPGVIFEHGRIKKSANVITCAAPNKNAAIKNGISINDNSTILRNRIEFIKCITEQYPTDILILGAYGCGVFGQNPVEVASIFSEVFKMAKNKMIIYAIPGGNPLEVFRNVFYTL